MISPSEFLKWCQVFNVNRGGGGGGGGDVVGPASSTDRAVVVFDGTTGKLVANSSAILDVDGNFTTPGVGQFAGGVVTGQLDTDIANVNVRLNLVNYRESMAYVGSTGSNFNNGQIVQARGTIENANDSSQIGQQINVDAGEYTDTSDFSMKVGVTLKGAGINNTSYEVTGSIGIDQGVWSGQISPYITIADMTLTASVAINFTPTATIADSTQRFNNVNHLTAVTLGNLTNLVIDGCNYGDLTISDVDNCRISNTTLTNSLTINVNTTSSIFTFTNVDFNNQAITVVNTGASNPIFNFVRCSNNNTFSYDDGFLGLPAEANFDLASWPVGGISDLGGQLIYKQTDEWGYVDTTNGFGNNFAGNPFFYDGSKSIFAAGFNAHTVLGTNQTLLGRATSSKSNVFVAAEATGVDFFPAQDNQYIVRYLNGYGFCTNDPKANFHIKAGNTGSMLFSANAAVTTGNISAGELNPYITATSLIFAGKYTGGGTFSYDLSSLGGDVTKAGDNVFTGQNTFKSYSLNNVTPVTLTANGGTLTVGQLFFGNTQFIPTADSTWVLPTQTLIDAALIGGSPGFGIGFDSIMFTNSSLFTVTFAPGTGTNFNGMSSPGILILGPGASVILKITKDNTPAYVYSGASFGSGSYAIFNVTGSTKTLGLIDSSSLQNCNSASAQTITFPLNSSVAFPIGTRIDGAQIGAGQTTLAATGGVTLQSQLGNLKTAFQYAGWTATKTATDTWLIIGNLSA